MKTKFHQVCTSFCASALRYFLYAAVLFVIGAPSLAWSHGMGGHRHDESDTPLEINNPSIPEAAGQPTTPSTGAEPDGSDPMVTGLFDEDHAQSRKWGAELGTFFESKHIHYGVTEAEGSPVYGTELTFWLDRFSLTTSGIFALQNSWNEWNFTAAYTLEIGPVFLVPGYNFRLSNHAEDAHSEHSDHSEHGHESGSADSHAHEEEHDEAHSHDHGKYGQELFLVFGTDAIPYVTPSVGFLWDFYENNGGFLEVRLDGSFPVLRDRLFLEPYTSLGLNFGYNTDEYYGWNNFLYGLNVRVALNSTVSIIGGVGQNVPFRAAELEGTESEVIATAGVSFSF